jgi:hypothetical protein
MIFKHYEKIICLIFKIRQILYSNASFLRAEGKYFAQPKKIVRFLFLNCTIPNKQAVVVGISQIKN